MHVGIAKPRWRGKRSRHSRRHMRNLKFYISGKRPIQYVAYTILFCFVLLWLYHQFSVNSIGVSINILHTNAVSFFGLLLSSSLWHSHYRYYHHHHRYYYYYIHHHYHYPHYHYVLIITILILSLSLKCFFSIRKLDNQAPTLSVSYMNKICVCNFLGHNHHQ